VAGAAPGECLIARRVGVEDPELGEFTFKRWRRAGAKNTLEPMSANLSHALIEIKAADRVEFVARFVQVLNT